MGIPPLKTNLRFLDTDADKANALNDYFSLFTRENNELFQLLLSQISRYTTHRGFFSWSC